jgi:DNA-binding CsgD family transcriptional regulator
MRTRRLGRTRSPIARAYIGTWRWLKGSCVTNALTHPGWEAEQFDEAIRALPLPFALVDIDQLTVLAASEAAAQVWGDSVAALVGRSVLDVVPADDQEHVSRLFDLLRSGQLRSYVTATTSGGTAITMRGSVIEFGRTQYLLVWLSAGAPDQPSPLARYLGREPVEMTVGTVDAELRILTVSSEGERMLDAPTDAIVGRRLIADMPIQDVRRLLTAGSQVDVAQSVALKVRWERAGESRAFTCFLAKPAGIQDLVFMLAPEIPPPADQEGRRTAELEHHLVRIAAEVEASGVLQHFFALPDSSRVPELQRLSARQWEIISRLLQGERVPTIAEELFVSPSTVRNQLSVIFRRFSVHSQAELLALLANRRPRRSLSGSTL